MAIHEEKYITTTPIQQEVELSRFRVDTEEDFFRWFKEWNCFQVVIVLDNIEITITKFTDGYEVGKSDARDESDLVYVKSIQEAIQMLESQGVKILENIKQISIHPVGVM